MVMHVCSAPLSLEAQLCFISAETIKSLGYNIPANTSGLVLLYAICLRI